MIPELTRAVGVPRLAGIGYPMSRPFGRPQDADGQRAVLRAMLELLATAHGPDTYVELPFEWPESPARARNASKDLPPPPIVELLTKKPWLLVNLYAGRIPHDACRQLPHLNHKEDVSDPAASSRVDFVANRGTVDSGEAR